MPLARVRRLEAKAIQIRARGWMTDRKSDGSMEDKKVEGISDAAGE